MPSFRFEARNAEGKLETGMAQGRRIREVVAQLQSQKMTIISIKEMAPCQCGADPTTEAACPKCGKKTSSSIGVGGLIVIWLIAMAGLWAAKAIFFSH